MRWSRVRSGPVPALLLVTAVALLARLWKLGWRVAHQDEGRVAHWTLHYMETGIWEYRPIIHGPFLPHVDGIVFTLLGANDFTMRLIVALFGALLPLGALLFRDRLRDSEVIGLGLFLAFNPLVLYYSRFFRNDVLTVGFMFLALGCFVRAYDRRAPAYLYAGTLALALAATTKENVLVYVGTWVGALALLLDARLFHARARGDDWAAVLAAHGRRARAGVARFWPALVLAGVEFLAVIVLFYAPRPDLWRAVTNPGTFPGVVGEATVGAWRELYGQWIAGAGQDHDYLPFLLDYLTVLRVGGLVVVVAAAAGFLLDRYAGDGQRPLVAFAAYWGFVSIPLYPLVSDISAPWSAVHAVVPLAIPAAVAVGHLADFGRRRLRTGDRMAAGLAALLLVLAGVQVAAAGADVVYRHPQDPGPMVQYGQPDDRLADQLADVRAVVATHDDGPAPEVAFYGDHFENTLYRLPFPWYFRAWGAETTHVTDPAALAEDAPPVVIAPANGSSGIDDTADDLRPHLDGYHEYDRRAIVLEIPGSEVWTVAFVDEDALARAGVEPGPGT